MERTLSLIKPDATRRNITGKIINKLESGGLKVIAQKRLTLTPQQARNFYAVHKDKPFFGSLVRFMTSGSIVAQVLEGENAVALNREIMGATDPQKAEAGTIRAEFAESMEANSVHGSDAPNTARQEISFFFSELELD